MSEFGMRNSASTSSFQGGGGSVDWYTPSAGGYGNYGNTGYTMPSTSNYASGSNAFEDEPPLLEELGIDLPGIFKKTRSILFHRLNNRSLEDIDMGGALVFIFILGGLHLLLGKLHFGIILGWSVVHSVVLWFLVNQLAGGEATELKGLELYSVCCLAGYCMVPLVLYSAVMLLIPKGLLSVLLAVLCTLWSALTAAKIFVRRCPALEDVQGLIMYPCMLVYAAFAMLTIY